MVVNETTVRVCLQRCQGPVQAVSDPTGQGTNNAKEEMRLLVTAEHRLMGTGKTGVRKCFM